MGLTDHWLAVPRWPVRAALITERADSAVVNLWYCWLSWRLSRSGRLAAATRTPWPPRRAARFVNRRSATMPRTPNPAWVEAQPPDVGPERGSAVMGGGRR